MTAFSIYEHVFPVVGCELDPSDGIFFIDQVFGTAFPISKDTYITAAHVITQACESKDLRVGCFIENKLCLVPIKEYDLLEHLDLAVFRAPDVPSGVLLPWQGQELGRLAEVSAAGYPFGYDADYSEVHARALRGSIVGVQRFRKFKEAPRVYELSFPCPRSLSGAPLVKMGEHPRIVGVVIGNMTTEMNIYAGKEVIKEDSTTIVERYEALHFGIALTTTAILSSQFRLLNGNLGDFIATNSGLT